MNSYKGIFDHLPLPALVLSPEGEALENNEAFTAAFPAPEDPGLVLAALEEALRAFRNAPEQTAMTEKDLRTSLGRKTFRVRLARVGTDAEGPADLLLFTDITERRRQAEEIDRLAAIVDSSDDAIFSVSLARKIMSWNHGAEHIYELPQDKALGASIMGLIPGSVAKEFGDILDQVAAGRHFPRHETINCRAAGGLFPVSMTLSPLIRHGETEGVTIVARDISTRRQTEDELKSSHRRLKSLMHETVESLSTAHEKRDLYTSGHQRSVSMIACCIADEMNLPHERIEGIRIAGLLHDIGKVCIPMAILAKPAVLSAEEMALMRRHSEAGYEIVKNIPFPWPVKDIILQHHERCDGSGYPRGLRGEAILLEARILAVADVLEAMSAHRPYRPALGLDKALGEIREHMGTAYDREACQAALHLVETGILRLEGNRLLCSL
jgi:PAS domain S-box-containing protein/putative nucleotidyltransferase with HDIG domain